MHDTEQLAKIDQTWDLLFRAMFEVRDDEWPKQVERLKEISRLALLLAAIIEGAE